MKNIVKILLFGCFVFGAEAQNSTVDDIELVFEVENVHGNKLGRATIIVTQDTTFGFDYTSLDSNESFFVKIGSQITELNGSGSVSLPVVAGDQIKIKMEGGVNNGKIFNFSPSLVDQFAPANWAFSPRNVRFENLPAGTNGFCPYAVVRNNFEWIEEVTFGSSSNLSGKDEDGHGIYRTFPITFFYDDTVLVQLSPGYKGRAYKEYWRIWIDLNDDNDYMDEDELIFEKSGKNIVSENVVFSNLTATGRYNMKVAMGWNAYPPACGSYVNGEFEEYTVLIRPPH